MGKPSKCPFCGQPLIDETAVRHLHRRQVRFEADLRQHLEKEAEAAAKEKLKVARAKMEERVRAEFERKHSAREKKLGRTVEELRQHNTELERRVEAINAPERGELHEADIFNRLVEAFPEDETERNGIGGDIVEVVRYSNKHDLEPAGTILYECKNTLRWNNSFLDQIKKDGKAHRTHFLLLVTRALPRGEKGMCVRDGVLVADADHAVHVARILRQMVIETHRAGLSGKDRAGKTARLYDYLTGDEFREEFASVVAASEKLNGMLEKERSAHERLWAKRKQAYDELGRNSLAIDEAIRFIVEAAPAQNGRPRRPTKLRRSVASARRRSGHPTNA